MALIAAVASAIGATAAFVTTEDQIRSAVDDSLTDRARELATFPGPREEDEHPPGSAFRTSRCPPLDALRGFAAVQVTTTTGSLLACGGLRLPRAAPGATPGAVGLRTATIDDTRYRVASVARRDGSVLQLARSLTEAEEVLDSLRIRLLVAGLAATVTAALLGWLLATRIVSPIRRLERAAQRIAATGTLDQDLPAEGPGEVGSLAQSFRTMVDTLGDSRERQQRLVNDASHELRTPLTALQTNAELLGRGEALTAEQTAQVSTGIRLEVAELTALVAELVALARDPEHDEPFAPVPLAAVAATAVDAARVRTEREVTLTVEAPATVHGSERMLGRAVANLLDNALQHGAGPVEVEVRGGTVEVRDHGDGIPAADLPHVFERFHRSVASRTRPGSGLGLAIVAQVAEAHGGTVAARNHPDGGAVVGMTLPVAP
jgi:two-component system sensor histidine kinase MprB